MSKPRKPHVVIVGGSLSGLFAGVALEANGYNSTILERSKEHHDQGAGIMAGGDVLEFLERYTGATRDSIAIPCHKRLYLNKDGTVAHQEAADPPHYMTSWKMLFKLLLETYGKSDRASARFYQGAAFAGLTSMGDLLGVHARRDSAALMFETANLVIAADGPSSLFRSSFEPAATRKYAGYCVLRGIVPAKVVSKETLRSLLDGFCFFHGPGTQCVVFTIPVKSLGYKHLNWVWYVNCEEGSAELKELMTDTGGVRRHITVPSGDFAQSEKIKCLATRELPPQMAELVYKTEEPFAQRITDNLAAQNLFQNDKIALVGDALAGFRPHTASSTNQAARNAMMLIDWLNGSLKREDFVAETMTYAKAVQEMGLRMGKRSQFQDLPLQEYIRDRQEMSALARIMSHPTNLLAKTRL